MGSEHTAVMDADGICRKNYVHTFENGDVLVVVEYISSHDVRVKFKCGAVKSVYWHDLINGVISNPYQVRVDGYSYMGICNGLPKERLGVSLFSTWNNMVQRCLDEKYKKENKSYVECSLSKEWENFQNFKKWAHSTFMSENSVLDKDLLFIGNKLYSPETCVFIPPEINKALVSKRLDKVSLLPTGVYRDKNKYMARVRISGKMINLGNYYSPEEAHDAYKKAKKDNFIRLAEKYKNQLCEKSYFALINREVL